MSQINQKDISKSSKNFYKAINIRKKFRIQDKIEKSLIFGFIDDKSLKIS